ncbi:uncharacterized protein LOC144636702 isoform X1 [Oculina patagonica]
MLVVIMFLQSAPDSFHNAAKKTREVNVLQLFYMSTGKKFTKSGIAVPLDSFGNEMCLLFIKYGRCRFKKKCRKSHWTPPLPVVYVSDEEYPMLPPLPLSPPPSSFDSCQPTKRDNTSQPSDKHAQNLLATETSYRQKKFAGYLENDSIGLASADSRLPNLQWFPDSRQPLHQDVPDYSAQKQTLETAQPVNMYQDIPNETDPEFSCRTSNISSMSPTFTSNIHNPTKGKEIDDSESSTIEGFTSVNANLAVHEAVDRIVHVVFKGRCRFDFVYHPNRHTKGNDWRYKSSIDQSYKQYGAYYDNVSKKLQVQHEPHTKAEKKTLKLLRRAHWNSCQVLKSRLSQLPSSYSLNVNFARVNYNRLRPYFYLLVQQCFFCVVDPAESQWRPTPFSCLVADTLIAFFINCNITPVEAEKKMQDWGARSVRVRQCISHMWNIIVKSSLSTAGVAQEVMNCEKQVFAKKLCAVDYAYACSLAAPLMKANVDKSTPKITKSVRQGMQAARKASLLEQNRKILKSPRVGENVKLRTKSAVVKTTSTTTLGNWAVRTNRATLKKKRKTRRSRDLSILNEQGKQDLEERCKTILGTARDCL